MIEILLFMLAIMPPIYLAFLSMRNTLREQRTENQRLQEKYSELMNAYKCASMTVVQRSNNHTEPMIEEEPDLMRESIISGG
jgi:hypothetical protein